MALFKINKNDTSNIINRKSILLSEDIINYILMFNEDFKLIYNCIDNIELFEGKEFYIKDLNEFKKYNSKNIFTENYSNDGLNEEEYKYAIYFLKDYKIKTGKNKSLPLGDAAMRINKNKNKIPVYYNYQYNNYDSFNSNCIATITITFDSSYYFNNSTNKSIALAIVSSLSLVGILLGIDQLFSPSIIEKAEVACGSALFGSSVAITANKLNAFSNGHSTMQRVCNWINENIKECPFEYRPTFALMKNIKNPLSYSFIFNIYAFKKI